MAYTLLADFTGNTTLTAGTYWMPYDINCNGYTLTFNCADGPIVIKRAGDYSFAFTSTVNTTNSTSTNKVYWTDKNDDTIGETISGSTGTPVKSGLVFNSIYNVGYTFTANFTATYWEIRYANSKQFIYCATAAATKSFQYITWKNCDYASTIVIINAKGNSGASTGGTFRYFSFDSTNTLTGSSYLLYMTGWDWSYIDYITIENANSSTACIQASGHTAYLGDSSGLNYIKIKNAGYYGVLLNDFRGTTTPLKINYSSSTFYCSALSGAGISVAFYDCLFDSALTGYSTIAIGVGTPGGASAYIRAYNCSFKTYTNAIFKAGLQYNTTLNCIFSNITEIFSANPTTQSNNYNGVHSSGVTYYSGGANDISADPVFANYDKRATIDSTLNIYGHADGYFASATAYQKTGSDTYDNLSIDETVYSPCGCRRYGTDKVNPGIYYKFSQLIEPECFISTGFDF